MLGPPVSCDSSSLCPLNPAEHSTPTQVITSASWNNVAPLNCGGILPPANQEPVLPLKDLKHHRRQYQRGLRSDFPTALISPKFAKKTHFRRQLMTAAHRNKPEGWADGHKYPFPPLCEAALAGTQKSKELWRRRNEIQRDSRDPFPASAAGLGSCRLPTKSRPFYPARSQSFPSRNHCAKMHNDNTCSKVFEPACSELNKEIILLLPTENPESTKGRQGSPGGGRSACKSMSRGVCAYSYFTT